MAYRDYKLINIHKILDKLRLKLKHQTEVLIFLKQNKSNQIELIKKQQKVFDAIKNDYQHHIDKLPK